MRLFGAMLSHERQQESATHLRASRGRRQPPVGERLSPGTYFDSADAGASTRWWLDQGTGNVHIILGALHEPEGLKVGFDSYENISSRLAKDCRDDTYATWGHHLLQHNASELNRLREHVRPILFQSI